jgi:hypothetical protein
MAGIWINLDPSTKRYVKMTAIRRLAAILAADVGAVFAADGVG